MDVRAEPRRPTRREGRPAAAGQRACRGRRRRARRARSRRTTLEQRPSAPIEQVGVVEVDVDDAAAARGERRARARSPSECVVGIAPSVASRGKLDDGRCGERRPALASRQVRRAAAPGACSRRSRARRTPPRPRRPCTSRRRRRASARAVLAQGSPLLQHARSRSPPLVGRAWSGAVQCVWCPSGPACRRLARPLEPRALVLSARSASAGRMSAAIGEAAGSPSCSAAKRAQTASSRGRSTWQDTTAYRSRDVAPIVREVSSPA